MTLRARYVRHTPTILLTALTLLIAGVACGQQNPTGPHSLQWGAYLPDLGGSDVTSDAGVVGVASLADRTLDYILTFSSLNQPVPLDDLSVSSSAGAMPVLTIEPWNPNSGIEQSEYRLARIAQGAHDSDIHRWATELATWGHPVILRFAHEMNGNWYPWGTEVNGNSASDYRAAWRHVHDIFEKAGAKNVAFMWAPMAAVAGVSDFTPAYPGSDYVDYLGLDGYNWGNDGIHGWASPDYIFTASLDRLRRLDGQKPVVIAEVASADDPDPTLKAAWIRQFISLASQTSGLSGFIWFQANKERDWRFNSTPQSESAFRSSLSEIPSA